jgi:hypothetical protein
MRFLSELYSLLGLSGLRELDLSVVSLVTNGPGLCSCLPEFCRHCERYVSKAWRELRLTPQMCRKGVLFFIRDPTERSYNPVKDILERPTMSQMRKVSLTSKIPTRLLTFSLAFQR